MPNRPKLSREDRLNEVLLGYVEACEAGREPDRSALLAAHPDLGDDLAAFFDGHDEIERLAAPLRESSLPIPANDSESPLGRLGDFLLIREVGRGGMGVVYEAEQISLRRRVALKVLPFAAAVDPRRLQRFKNEAMAAAHLQHENIVPVFAVGCERGVHYYAMQFVEGQSLAALIAELRLAPERSPSDGGNRTETTSPVALLSTQRSNGGNYFDWVARLGWQAARALEHAHRAGIVHRDIKPGNLLLDGSGQIWVADFGLAQVSDDSRLTATGELLGTLRYASPEQALGRGVVDHRGDVYSLGATLYELLALRPPFDGRDRHELLRRIAEEVPPALRSLDPAIPESLETIVLKALRKEASDRYPTAQEFADDLQRFLDRQPILARRPNLGERFRVWARRHPATLAVLAVVLILVSVGSLITAALVRAEQERTEQAYRRERQRAEEAEARFALARRAVDELFRVSEEELADRPGMELLRNRLLRTALAYYQEFLAEDGDPGARAGLLDTARRVETILEDLAVLRAATHFYLLRQPTVLDELRLTPEQLPGVKDLTARVGKQWAESFRDIGLVAPSVRGRRSLEQARANEAELNALLTPAQQARLRQIGLQSEGPGALRDPEVAAALALTPAQRERIRVIEDDAVFGWMRSLAPPGAGQPAEPNVTPASDRILAELTDEQARKWRELTGEPVKGTVLSFGAPAPSVPKKAGSKSP